MYMPTLLYRLGLEDYQYMMQSDRRMSTAVRGWLHSLQHLHPILCRYEQDRAGLALDCWDQDLYVFHQFSISSAHVTGRL